MNKIEREVRARLDQEEPPFHEKWKQGAVEAVEAVRANDPGKLVELLPGAALAASDVVGMFGLEWAVHYEELEGAHALAQAELRDEAQRRV